MKIRSFHQNLFLNFFVLPKIRPFHQNLFLKFLSYQKFGRFTKIFVMINFGVQAINFRVTNFQELFSQNNLI